MVQITTQRFWDSTGNEHSVTVRFGGISLVSNGYYEVVVDGVSDYKAKIRRLAYDRIATIISDNNWRAVNPI